MDNAEQVIALLASIVALIGTILQEIRDWLRQRNSE